MTRPHLLHRPTREIKSLGLYCAAVATVCAVLLAVLYFAAARADWDTRQNEERTIAGGTTTQFKRHEAAVAPRANWDEAVRNLDNRFNPAWAESTFGGEAQDALGLRVAIILDPDGAPLFANQDGEPLSPAQSSAFIEAGAPLIAAVRRAEAQRGPLLPSTTSQVISYPIQSSASALVAGRAYLLSASLVQPSFGRVLPRGQRAPIVLSGQPYSMVTVRILADRYTLQDAQLAVGREVVDPSRATHVLRDSARQPVATMHWRPHRPGMSVFYKAAPAVCLVVLALAACLFLVLWRYQSVNHSLARSEARMKLALKAATAGAFEIDVAGRAVWSSPEMDALLGRRLTFEEAVQTPWPFVHPDDHAAFLGDASAPDADGKVSEVRIMRPDGEVRWVRLAIRWSGSLSGARLRATGLVLDIHERKQQELALIEAERAANAAVEAKSRFLATVSHEIRTPMNGILGVMHLLKDQRLAGDGAQLLGEALACGEMLTGLIDDVLDFSKIEAGQLELTPAPVNPVAVVEGVAKLLRPQCDAKGITLTTVAGDDLGWVSADPLRLRQALFNLVGNAVKFTREGGVSVRIMRTAPARLRFEITDSGVGIPLEAQAGVFDPFHQGDSSTTRRFGGTGLGLTITRRLARMMGGDVGFESREAEGSTFWFELAAPAAQPPAEAPAAPAAIGPLRVLVVEDNPTNRLVVTRLLEAMGLSVETADDGRAGVEAARWGGFDVILMDVQMPVMDGLEATRCIRAMGGILASTPIIALTANAMTHQKQSYALAGMDGVVAKPISPGALLTEIARVTGSVAEDGPPAAIAV